MKIQAVRDYIAKNGTAIVLAATLTLALLAMTQETAQAAEQVKIGYLDLDRVVQAVARQTPEYDELTADLDKRAAEIERRRAEIDRLQEELEANEVIWSPSKVREQRKVIQDQVDDRNVFAESAKRFHEVEQNKILRRLLPEIAKTVKKIGERDGYSMIFEKRMLLYGSPNFNLTDTIIKELSENKPE
jgi:outer membrane protein